MVEALYPIKFKPQLKQKIWGGKKLISKLSKEGTAANYGESWEISDVKDSISVIDNGKFKGKSLKWLLKTYKSDLLGQKNYSLFGDNFPLLIKFIDAKTDLSVQLHPNDNLAKERHNSFGKTEMWYVMQADEDSNLIIGFNRKMNREDYVNSLNNKTLVNNLNFVPVKEGDTFFIEVGKIHAIGGGVLLAEIQQTSDITYRVYDWDRVDEDGNSRELHLDLALDAIDFNNKNISKVTYEKQIGISNPMVHCKYFKTNFLNINSQISRVNKYDSFIIYMCVGGNASIKCNGESYQLSYGETLLIPASVKHYDIDSKKSKLLEIHV